MNAIQNLYVVDDDAMVRRSTVMMMTGAGYAVQPFGGGRDFLDASDWLPAGCVLLDVRMPDIDGFGVLTALSDRPTRFSVIMMTGHGDIPTAVQAMKLGAVDFLEKPFDDEALFEILDRAGDELADDAKIQNTRQEAQRKVAKLTAREREVLSGLTAGLPNKLVADRLSLSIRTVEMHRANLMDKLGARALADALRIGFRADLPPLSD